MVDSDDEYPPKCAIRLCHFRIFRPVTVCAGSITVFKLVTEG